jgi:tetratricopeptide (TPR) repeat protein
MPLSMPDELCMYLGIFLGLLVLVEIALDTRQRKQGDRDRAHSSAASGASRLVVLGILTAVLCGTQALRNGFYQRNLGHGRALMERAEYSTAIKALRSATWWRADLPWAHYELGIAFNRAGQHAAAVSELRTAIRLFSEDRYAPGRQMELADALYRSGRKEEAIAEWQSVIDTAGRYVDDARRRLATAHERNSSARR